MSDAERPDRIDPAHTVTIEDIRALSGPATPHFALQIRTRIARLIDSLPEDDPVRIAGEREMERLLEIAGHSGEPRGPGPRAHA